MKNILNEIKWAYQRVARGYDDRIYWGFNDYLVFVPRALKRFCIKELLKKEINNPMNSERKKVYQKMISLITGYQAYDYQDKETESRMWEYFGKNIIYFWD